MEHNRLKNPETLKLFHGSLGLIGKEINIQSGKGIGWNSLTLGDAFYTSLSQDAAILFSHLVLQKSRLSGGEAYENLGFAKVYQIFLDESTSILDADQPLDAFSVRSVLSCAGVSEKYLNLGNKNQFTDFYKAADLLRYGTDWEGNRNEYLTRNLGYDGIMIKEKAWDTWDYYPNDIEINWDNLTDPLVWPPKTIAIYNAALVTGFDLNLDGRIYEENLSYLNR